MSDRDRRRSANRYGGAGNAVYGYEVLAHLAS